MPRRDGTGPMGCGPMTGRGLGVCTGVNAYRYGSNRRGGFGRGFFFQPVANEGDTKEMLMEQQQVLKARMDDISRQLESLSEKK
ncbi:MAG: DUF5320 domain-containing protein [Clostridia bacterium]